MNERFEIEVIACCPECGCCFTDWIPIDVEYPFLFEDVGSKCTKKEGEITHE